jgi:hypothetical protein
MSILKLLMGATWFLLAAGLMTPGTAAVALWNGLDNNNTEQGEWIVVADPNQLDERIREGEEAFSVANARVVIRCNGTGWIAEYWDNQVQAYGYACGYPDQQSATVSALEQCQRRSNNCRPVHIVYDDGTRTMPPENASGIAASNGLVMFHEYAP